ncbi:MAG TPA: hypothetical protein VFK70_19320 [Vicinamibacteria bacterium]|nr:hypothetical protein [Vicinamibacteria bacterium]
MNDRDDEKDEDLAGWLRQWESPKPSARLDERVRQSFREARTRESLWKRLLSARVSLPLPVAALLIGVALVVGLAAGRRLGSGRAERGDADRAPAVAGEGGLANLRPLPEVKLTVLREGGSDDRR